ncbi:MAG: Gfo/Idh/MocA family protein [Enterococcus lemanii]|jgi:predicted dehydrogenase
MKTTKIAIIGIGAISGIYLENLTSLFQQVEIIGVCDLIVERAKKAIADYRIPKLYLTMEEAFADEEVEIILNLTRPYEHYAVTKAALLAGKHVYSEKPLAATISEGEELVALAKAKQLALGGAPDTFLGAALQTCRKLIDDGFIGEVVGFHAAMLCRGHESWHPDPAFYYQFGGGPMMDMGPYYLTALTNLLGRVESVMAVAKKTFATRTITSQPQQGQTIEVDVPTYLSGILTFENGVIGNLTTTFDVVSNQQAHLEIYGSKGSLRVPDPNFFGEKIYLLRSETPEYKEIPLLFDYQENSRGLGLADMAQALKENRPIRANVSQTFHVLEVMTAFVRSSENEAKEVITSSFERAAPMKAADVLGVL